jgi:hypothetical protein
MANVVRTNRRYGSSITGTILLAGLGIAAAGFVATGLPSVAAFIEQGIALGAQVLGFVVTTGSVIKGGQVLLDRQVTVAETAGVGLAALSGAALVLVGNLIGG